MSLLITIRRVEGFFFFEIVKPTAIIFSWYIRDVRRFLELKLFPLDALEEGVSLNFINSISTKPVVGITKQSL